MRAYDVVAVFGILSVMGVIVGLTTAFIGIIWESQTIERLAFSGVFISLAIFFTALLISPAFK